MNLYGIKPHDDTTGDLYYVTGTTYGQAVRKYKTRRSAESPETWPNWKDVPEPAKVALVSQGKFLIAGREG